MSDDSLVRLNDSERAFLRFLLQEYGKHIYWNDDLQWKGLSYEDYLNAVCRTDELFKKLSE